MLLSIFLLNLAKDLTDKAFEIHDRLIINLISKGRKAQEELQKQNGKKITEKIIQFTSINKALIKAKENNLDPYKVIEEIMYWSTLVKSIEIIKSLNKSEKRKVPDNSPIDFISKR